VHERGAAVGHLGQPVLLLFRLPQAFGQNNKFVDFIEPDA
jgi:hypothetical protein